MTTSKPCSCGSGLPRYELLDAAGIFCAYVCDFCEEEKKSKFNPTIFDTSSPYASTGNEADLFIDTETDHDD